MYRDDGDKEREAEGQEQAGEVGHRPCVGLFGFVVGEATPEKARTDDREHPLRLG